MDARGLAVARGGREVLHALDFEIASGTLTGLIGPSGGGKTTLLRSVVGVQRGVTGSLVVLGEPAGAAPLRARVAYLTQAPSIYADLTVAENLHYFARILDAPAGAIGDALHTVHLAGNAGRTVRSLSGGERARVSLATALLGQPELLVLDEPTVGLDPLLRRDLWDTFARLASAGATLLVSSHVMDEAEHCERVMLLRDGRLLAHDTPQHLLDRTGTSRLEDAFVTFIEHGGDQA